MKTMTDEQLRVRIAEACGWTRIEWYEDNQGPPILHGYPPSVVGLDSGGEWAAKMAEHTEHVPNYLFDLNTIQAAVLSMPVEFQLRFNDAFHKHFGRRFNGGFVQFTWQLTARDWCETFVAALEP